MSGGKAGKGYVIFVSLASYRLNDLRTPWKIHMEHNSLEVLVQIIFLSFPWVMAVGSSR